MSSKMRFEQVAAYSLGAALPILEIMRRGPHIDFLPAYIDDFIAGGLLLYAAIAMTRKRKSVPVLLVVAWAVLCGGLYYSFFGQIQNASPNDISGLSNPVVVLIKGGFFVLAIVCLCLSVRRVVQTKAE